MSATWLNVVVEMSVTFPGQARQAGETLMQIASCGGNAKLVSVGGTELAAPQSLGLLFVQVWDRTGNPSPLFVGLSEVVAGDVLRLSGALQPNARPPKKGSDSTSWIANWRLEATKGRRLAREQVILSSVDGVFQDDTLNEEVPF